MVYTSKSRPIYSKEGGGGIAINEDCCKCGPDCLCTFQKVSFPITASLTCPKEDPEEDIVHNVQINLIEEEDWEESLPPEQTAPREDICQVAAGRWVPSVLDCTDPDITGVDLVVVWRRTGTDPKHVSLYWKVDDTEGEGEWFATGADESLSECDPLPPCLVFSDVTVPGCCDPEDFSLRMCPKDNECPQGEILKLDVVLYKEKDQPDIYDRWEEVDRQTLELKDDGVPGIPRSAAWTWDIEGQTYGPYHVRFSCLPGEVCSSWDVWTRKEGDLSWNTATLGGCAYPTGCCGDPIQGFWFPLQDDIPVPYFQDGEVPGNAWRRCGCFTAHEMDPGNPIAYGILPDGTTVDFTVIKLGQAGNPGSFEGEFCETLRIIMDLNSIGCPHISQMDLGVLSCGNIDSPGLFDLPVEWLFETYEEAPHNRCFGELPENPDPSWGHNLPQGCDKDPNDSWDVLSIGNAPEECQNCPEWLTIAVHWREIGLDCAVNHRPDSAGVGSALASKVAKLSWMFPSLNRTQGCSCKREERRLNRLGPAYVREHLEEELDRLQARAEREARAFNRLIARLILLKCCREVEKRQ